jgi:F-type H+-transporting ATPase subunit a
VPHSFKWFDLIPSYDPKAFYWAGTIVVVFLVFLLGLSARRRLVSKDILPSGKFDASTPFELISDFLTYLLEQTIGPGADKYLPLVGGVFIFVFANNLLGMIPGFLPPTESLNTNLACALTVFVMTHYYGVKSHGFGYMKHFKAPLAGIAGIALTLLFAPIEIIGNLFRVVSLSARLWGNIFGDHLALDLFVNSIPSMVVPAIFGSFFQGVLTWVLGGVVLIVALIILLIVGVFFTFLGFFVSFMQAFIFAMLTIIYIRLATSEAH